MSEHYNTIEDVRAQAVVCRRCGLCHVRTHVVFGEGPVPARLMLVGEGPGADEDRGARPFVGRAGRLLDRLLSEAGIIRDEVWVTNIVRCRPASKSDGTLRDRPPRADEIAACDAWMKLEYRFVSPELVVCLGTVPAQALISRDFRLLQGRGRWYAGRGGIPTTATYHPAYLLRLGRADREVVQAQMLYDLHTAWASQVA